MAAYNTNNERPAYHYSSECCTNVKCTSCSGITSCSELSKTKKWGILITFLVGILLVCILVPLSFTYIQYNEFGFIQNKYGSVDTSYVYTQGRYFATLIYEFVMFPSTYQLVKIVTPVFTSSGLQITLTTTFYYNLPKSNLPTIYNLFSKNYDSRVISIAKTTIKNIAAEYTVDDYLSIRSQIEYILANNVSTALHTNIGVGVPPEYFKIISLIFPDSLIQSSLRSAIALQNNQIQAYNQELQLVLTDTNKTVSAINANASAILATAGNFANQIVQNSLATYNNIIVTARGNGISNAVQYLNLTDHGSIDRFIELMAMMDNNNITLFYGNYYVQPVIGR